MRQRIGWCVMRLGFAVAGLALLWCFPVRRRHAIRLLYSRTLRRNVRLCRRFNSEYVYDAIERKQSRSLRREIATV